MPVKICCYCCITYSLRARENILSFLCDCKSVTEQTCVKYGKIMEIFLEESAVDEPVCSGNWTEYYNRDLPGGVGDFETLTSLRRENPGEICDNPTAVDARVVGVHTHYSQTGENIGISLDEDFIARTPRNLTEIV